MNAKLIAARAKIEKILAEHDIAGYVFLHASPGDMEVFFNLSPSYSRLVAYTVPGGDVGFRLVSHVRDYGGDRAAQMRDLAATANMAHGMATLMAQSAIPMLEMARTINRAVGAEHTDAIRTEGRPQ